VNNSVNLRGPDDIHTNWIEGLFGCFIEMHRKYDATWIGTKNLFYI
jgi:hypothetical protein